MELFFLDFSIFNYCQERIRHCRCTRGKYAICYWQFKWMFFSHSTYGILSTPLWTRGEKLFSLFSDSQFLSLFVIMKTTFTNFQLFQLAHFSLSNHRCFFEILAAIFSNSRNRCSWKKVISFYSVQKWRQKRPESNIFTAEWI